MYMKQLKENALPFLTFVIVVALVRHIISFIVSKKAKPTLTMKDYLNAQNKQTYISLTDLTLGLLYIIFIRSCCGKNLVKTVLMTIVLVYLAIPSVIGISYEQFFSKDGQLMTLIGLIGPVLAALSASALIR
jgi:hypothetical protein